MLMKNAIAQSTWTKHLRWSRIQVSRGLCCQSKQRTALRVFNSSFITAIFLLATACKEQSTADDMSMPHAHSPDNEERENFDSFLSCLKDVVQLEDIEIDEDECRQRGKPWNSYHKVSSYPRIIISPTTTSQVQLFSSRFWPSYCTPSRHCWCSAAVAFHLYEDHSVNKSTTPLL